MKLQFDVAVTDIGTGIRSISAKEGNNLIEADILPIEIQSINELANWLLDQTGTLSTANPTLQARLAIDFHLETVNDDLEAGPYEKRVIDSIVADLLPSDEGKTNFQAMPGWSSWTGNEAESWIVQNVTDLASAKIALRAIARAIIFLRNVVID